MKYKKVYASRKFNKSNSSMTLKTLHHEQLIKVAKI